MKVASEFNFRNAKEIIQQTNPELLENRLNLEIGSNKERDTSKQIKRFFLEKGWKEEVPPKSISDMRYDLVKDEFFPVEVEVGHMRLVYADFFEYLADYSKSNIKAAIMVVCNEPKKFGHTWHNSLKSTKNKLEAIKETFLVPILVIGIDP